MLDNPYKDFGLLIWWDERFSRLFVTKKDWRLINEESCCVEYDEDDGFVQNLTECSEVSQVVNCPEGYTYDATKDKCVIPATELTCEFDLMFNIDISGSISCAEMTLEKNFIIDIINGLRQYIEDGDVKVGITAFNSIAYLQQTMITGQNQTDVLITAVNNLTSLDPSCPRGFGLTAIDEGLCSAHEQFDADGRLGFSKKIITITDGGVLIVGTSQKNCNPLFVSSIADDIEDDLNDTTVNKSVVYENIVVGIDLSNSAVTNYPVSLVEYNWNTIHNSSANGGNAYLSEFIDLDVLVAQLLSGVCTTTGVIEIEPPKVDATKAIDVATSNCFEECSWTISYSPITKTWISYHSFFPNFVISHPNYFQTGLNWANAAVYSHLLTERSFGVYYGVRHPWKVQVPLKNTPLNKFYQTVKYKLFAYIYDENGYDRIDTDYDFTSVTVFTNNESTGLMNLIPAIENNLQQYITYPKYISNAVDILVTKEFEVHKFGGLFNRAVKGRPMFLHNCSASDKTVNPAAHRYISAYHDLLRGSNGASILFVEESNSQIKFLLDWVIDERTEY